uniref:Uncharacterized protein n=1 Tax=Rhizophora mucronata TaxID=61149 RepID=A0A2P2NYY3_RHIMU
MQPSLPSSLRAPRSPNSKTPHLVPPFYRTFQLPLTLIGNEKGQISSCLWPPRLFQAFQQTHCELL